MKQQAVIVMLDGLRRDLVDPDAMPVLAGFATTAERFQGHRSVFPSTTRVCAASLVTGCHPGRHGIHGNVMALVDAEGRLSRHVVGAASFAAAIAETSAPVLRVPSLAERLAASGKSFLAYSNVSPGAALVLDPKGFGTVYHRDGADGANPRALEVTHDAEGDRAMTERFCADLRSDAAPDVGLLWLCEPDLTQHDFPLGSPQSLAALASADRCLARVLEACRTLAEEPLLVVGSDHGHQTAGAAIDLEAILADGGFDAALESGNLLVAANGTGALIYLTPREADQAAEIAAWLLRQPAIGDVMTGRTLSAIGHSDHGPGMPAIAVSMRDYPEAVNAFGVPGISDVVSGAGAEVYQAGCGNHGGLGAREQAPVLLIRGPGFTAGMVHTAPSSLVDIAPTVLEHFEIESDGLDGTPLQQKRPPMRRPA